MDGTQFTAATAIALRTAATVGLPNGTVAITAANGFTGNFVTIAIATPGAVGTYSLASTAQNPVPQNASVQNASPSALWNCGASFGGTGSVTISELTATNVSGSFAFTAVPLAGTAATSNKVVTEGSFNVKF